MKIFIKSNILGIIFNVLFSTLISAEESSIFSLSAAQAEAKQNNPELRLLRAHIQTITAKTRSSKTYLYNPELIYSDGLDRHIGISQTIEWPGKRAFRRAIANHDVTSAQIALSGFEVSLESDVRRAFGELLAAKLLVNASEDDVKDALLVANAAKERAKKGFLSSGEELKSRVELVNAKSQFQSAEQAVLLAEMALNQLLGRPDNSPIQNISDTLADIPSDLPLETLISTAAANNPDLMLKNIEVSKSHDLVSLAKRERFPDINIEAFNENEKSGFGVTIPLPVWSLNGAEIATSKAEMSEAEISLEKNRQDVSYMVRKAYNQLEGVKNNLSLFSEELVKQLEAQSRFALKKYMTGEFPLITLVDLHLTRRNYIKDYIAAKLAVCKAWSELEKAVGIPLEKIK